MISLHSNRNPNKVTILWKIATKPYSLIWPLSSSWDWLSKYWSPANKISYVAIKLYKQIKWFVLTWGSPFIFLIYYFPQNTCVSLYPEAVLCLIWPKSSFPSLLLLYLLIHSLSPVFASHSLPTVICGKLFFYLLRTWSLHVMWWLQGELQILFIFLYVSVFELVKSN